MTLLKLAPDSERLRRIARAYAAGEMDEEEYRRIRAEVIEGFVVSDNTADDTEQRWTPPPMERVVLPAVPGSSFQHRSSRRTPWLVGALVAVLLSIVVYLLL